MQNVASLDADASASLGASTQSAHMENLPLTFLRNGDSAKVVKVRGKEDIHHHLENLGFTVGTEICVISEQSGNLIVEIKGSQVALDRSVASKIITNMHN